MRPATRAAAAASWPLSDAALLDGLRNGDLNALAAAFDRWHGRVRVLARRLLAEEAAAEDVVQDVLPELPLAVRRFDGRADLQSFVLRIAVKRVRRHRRATLRRRRALARLNVMELGGSGLAGGPSPNPGGTKSDKELTELARVRARRRSTPWPG